MAKEIPSNLLADTWWYGLTHRWTEKQMLQTARLRAIQGFNAVQVVVGIPPEVGPENPNAASLVGPAWNLKGQINTRYLESAKTRINKLNGLGLLVIAYGAWGQQIDWLGVEGMKNWWGEIIHVLDKLNVIYCLTGESDLWPTDSDKLLPNKSTGDLIHLPKHAPHFLKVFGRPMLDFLYAAALKQRREKWNEVLKHISTQTIKPIFIHTLGNECSYQVADQDLLSAVTTQTGHDPNSREELWKRPVKARSRCPGTPFINLEPWYEGIKGDFQGNDQLYAYWASRMAGAAGFCYGAQGVWNLGEGKFLSHWGKQTLAQALALKTPGIIGLSHSIFNELVDPNSQPEITTYLGRLKSIKRGQAIYYPDVHFVPKPPGKVWLPTEGRFTSRLPKSGQIVVIP